MGNKAYSKFLAKALGRHHVAVVIDARRENLIQKYAFFESCVFRNIDFNLHRHKSFKLLNCRIENCKLTPEMRSIKRDHKN